jgi:hypothetical protein
MEQILRLALYLAFAVWLGGCSTLQGDFHQNLQIDALDAQNRPVNGLECQVGSGTSAKTVVTPGAVRVHRAMTSLEIECRRDKLVATATVKSRRERMEEALLPFGSVGVFVDHLSGSLYSYPTALHLRVGQHLVLEHGAEAQVASAEALPLVAPAGSPSAAAQHTDLAAAQPAAPAHHTDSTAEQAAAKPATMSSRRAAASARKPQAAPASKSDRATAKPVKGPTADTATAAATAKTRTASSKIAVTAPAAAAAAVAVPSAPANW